MTRPLLELRELRVHFPVYAGLVRRRLLGTVRAVDGVSLDVAPGETVGLVGESGCGKSTLARAVVRLVPCTGGTVGFEGREISALREPAFRAIRPRLQLIFQDPYASLNPRMAICDLLTEGLAEHRLLRGETREAAAARLLAEVGLDESALGNIPSSSRAGSGSAFASRGRCRCVPAWWCATKW